MLKCHFLVWKTGTWFGEPSSTPPAIKNSLEYPPPPAPTPGERLIILGVIPVPSNSVQNFTFSEWLNFGSNPYHSVTTKIVRSQLLLKTKNYHFFFPNGPTIHKFEDCFPRVQVSTNGFKVFNGCLFESWVLLVCLQKKKKKTWEMAFAF